VTVTDLPRQFLAERCLILPFWRANVRREVSGGGSQPQWNIENELRELRRGEPGKAAAVVSPTEGQPPVAVNTVPAQVGHIETFAAHGLHWVPEQRLEFTYLDTHF
jgi:hypothetical protein